MIKSAIKRMIKKYSSGSVLERTNYSEERRKREESLKELDVNKLVTRRKKRAKR